ncbi:MAG: 50S ribosomal protein L29 [Flavobacteriales bacterium]|jgi:large subunit ribosomal protein L29|uniref:50S ribosomal protein L29 n=1 Tax=Sanyastnella coralliicola TaxID=3069118 RepID=UPI0027BAAA2C|nr:50S ribosomal protein L29 [Longitalea sp. SCSIO 12813]MCH2197677.1 50S ribosomal protein L29 [Flavobacteriales bacterium]
MKMEEIKQLSDLDLAERIQVAREELSKLRFNHSIAGLEDANILSSKKKDIARLLTELSARKKA